MTPLQVLHEDDRLIAAAKPAGQDTIPARGKTAFEPLNLEVSRHVGAPVFVVHRLDREASGLVLFAKDADAHRLLCACFERHKVDKAYLALVEGLVVKEGSVEQPLRAFGSGRIAVDPSGKPSLTRFRPLRRFVGATLLEARPMTGRRHQLRVHFYAIGHPILGDTKYGVKRPVGGAPRLMLHALALSLEGPVGPLSLRCEPPEDFTRVLDAQGPANP